MTNLPEIGATKLMIIANEIFRNRAAIAESAKNGRKSLRDVISSSEICSFMKKAGIYIEIGNVKVLLREFGFNFNGPSISLFDLFSVCKNHVQGVDDRMDSASVDMRMRPMSAQVGG